MPTRDPYTGKIIEDEHPILNSIRAAIEANIPGERIVRSILYHVMPEGKYKSAMGDPYAGKNIPETALAMGADATNQAANLAMPAEGAAAQALKFGGQALVNTGLGLGANAAAKAIQSNPEAQSALQTPLGKTISEGVENYAMPAASILLSGKPALNWMGKVGNTEGNAVNFLKNKLTKSKSMEAMGFDSTGGKLKQTADELSDSIQRGVNEAKAKSSPVYEQVSPMPMPKEMVTKLLDDMENAKSPLTDRGSLALNKDIDRYIEEIKKFKNPTVGDIDLKKQSFWNDMNQVKNDFSSTKAEAVGNEVSHLIQKASEDALPDGLREKFIEAKQNWGSMAKHVEALRQASKADPTTMINKLKTGEQVDALAHFADPAIVDKALKVSSHFKNAGNPEKMISDYAISLQKMDAVNPGIADKVSQIGMGKSVNPAENVNPLTNFLNNKQYEAYTRGGASPWSDIMNKANIEGAAAKGSLPLNEVPKYIKPSDMLFNAGGNALNDLQNEINVQKEK